MTKWRREGEPTELSVALARVAAEFGAALPSDLDAVSTRLAALFGDEFGTMIVIRSFVNGELALEVADTRVASDLRYRQEEIADALMGAVDGSVKRVKVVVKRS